MSSLPINGLDLAVIVILLISALLALLRGFVQETLSIGAWAGAAFGSLYGVRFVQPYFRDLIPLDWAADAAAMAALFLVILFALSLVTNMVARTVQKSALNPLDRSLGFLFGLVRGAVIVCVAMIIADWLMKPDDRPQWIQTAKTLPLLEDGADVLKGLVPQSFQRAEDAAKGAAEKVNEAAEMKRSLDKLTGDKLTADKLSAPQAAPTGDTAKAAPSNAAPAPVSIEDLIGQKMQEIDAKTANNAGMPR